MIPRLLLLAAVSMICVAQAPKQRSAFYPPALIERAKANAAKYPWAARMQKQIVESAEPWMKLSDEELWQMMFGSTLMRSHHVWSAGYCPACRKSVPMYDWQIDAFERPWKVRCPHCREQFPKNDFPKFYRSGLDEHNVFDPKKADRSLLFNAEHPDPNDPLRTFGVEDGTGYAADGHRWYFIGAYLQYGQWGQKVLGGLSKLGAAYGVTGDARYAHKAVILLDRVADVWPDFDFAEQGLVYERAKYGGGTAGYVTYSIDSAYEARKLALAYDQVFEALQGDQDLVRFLSEKAARFKLANPKTSFAGIQHNIEDRVLRDVVNNPKKIRTNYPGAEGAITIIKTILGWPENRQEVLKTIDQIVAESTPVDGTTGEKGLAGYATIAPNYMANLLEHYARANPDLISDLIKRHPKFRETYRFFLDTWSGRQYYPHSGDSGAFAIRSTDYAGLSFDRGASPDTKYVTLPPVSMFTFLWRMYKATGDSVYLQILRMGNRDSTEGLPHDIYADDPEALIKDVERVVAKEGAIPRIGSVNKQEWRLAILRPKQNPDAGAVWLDYDSVPNSRIKSHYHRDAMNLGLFWKGLDFLPEFGYPAVQFGDWHTPQATWHLMTAAHNTVVVDGKNQLGGDGQTELWADGQQFRAIRATSPGQYKGRQYERTVAMVNITPTDIYVFDVFRVAGGTDHAKFTHSHFSELVPAGLTLAAAPDYGSGTLTRNFRVDPNPKPGWSVDFKIQDRLGYLPAGADMHLRYSDLTKDAQAYTCESWTVRNASSTEQFWIPTVMVRRQAKQEPLASTFVSILEPYENTSNIVEVRRVEMAGFDVAVQIKLKDGRADLLLAADASQAAKPGAELAWIRRSATGKPEAIAVANGETLDVQDILFKLKKRADFVELTVTNGRAQAVTGKPGDAEIVRVQGKLVTVR